VPLEEYLETLPADETARSEAQQNRLRQLEAGLAFMQARQEAFVRRRQELAEGTNVANAFAIAANYIFFTDFATGTVSENFSDRELSMLGEHPDALNSMIRTALGRQNSVGGAMLMAHSGSQRTSTISDLTYLRQVEHTAGRGDTRATRRGSTRTANMYITLSTWSRLNN
jgi:hypothetical protein